MANTQKKLIAVHGDKGGIGKSTAAGLGVDYALTHYGAAAVVEGDTTIADVARRFGEVQGVQGFVVDLSRSDAPAEAVIGLFEELEKAGLPPVVIINTPASASKTLDAQAEVLVSAAHDMNYSVRVAWLIGPDDDSATLSAASKLCALADRKVAVVNDRFGTANKYPWFRHPARAAWLQSGGLESALPLLTERAALAVKEHMGRYSTLADQGSPLTIITRRYVGDWVRQSFAGPMEMLFADSGE